jgi:preprotein translocase subunit SecA
MLESLMKSVFGSKHERDRRRVEPIVDEINQVYESYEALTDDQLRAKTTEFRGRLAEALKDISDPEERKRVERETLDDLLPEAFAAVKLACARLVGRTWPVVGIPISWDMVPYDV